MNLRWFQKASGEKVLQRQEALYGRWEDVPFVEEPRRAREWWIQPHEQGAKLNVTRIRETDDPALFGKDGYIKVREVLND